MLDDDELELVDCGDRTRLCVRDDFEDPDEDDDEDLAPGVEPPRRSVIHHVIHQAKPTFWERREAEDLRDEEEREFDCESI